jgi:predicted enzyme related to lactoylglutathione lyase
MFESAQFYGVLPAFDLERAVQWWKDVFGIDPDMIDEGGVMYRFAGIQFLVYETQFAGTAQNTAFGIDTDDFDRDMAALRDRGVTFNEYDLPGLTTVDGVAEYQGVRSAWFNDSEGNVIALSERRP